MEQLTISDLLKLSFDAGLVVDCDGYRLEIEGPDEAAPIAYALLERRAELWREVRKCLTVELAHKPGRCLDCDSAQSSLIMDFCAECANRRLFLSSVPPCGCLHARRWRHRDKGFRWYCETHDPAPERGVIWSRGSQAARVLPFGKRSPAPVQSDRQLLPGVR